MSLQHHVLKPLGLLLALSLTGCGDSFELSAIKPVTGHNADGSGHFKQMTLSWSQADPKPEQSYRVCERDLNLPDECHELAQTNGLKATVDVPSLIEAEHNEYFVLTQVAGKTLRTSSQTIKKTDITRMIGYLKASNPSGEDWFGRATAISADGSVMAVGAPYEDSGRVGVNMALSDPASKDNGATDSGAVYLYEQHSQGAWYQAAYVKAPDTHRIDHFGYAIALSHDGQTLAVGAPNQDADKRSHGNKGRAAGGVYIYKHAPDGTWRYSAMIQAPHQYAKDCFGYSLTLNANGSVLAVGAPFNDADPQGIRHKKVKDETINSGVVYLFKADSTDRWQASATLKAANAGRMDHFGYALSLNAKGDLLAVGAYREDSNNSGDESGAEQSGAVYLFNKGADNWQQTHFLKASDAKRGDGFGLSLALAANGQTLAVGAPLAKGENGTKEDAGALYLFRLESNNWKETARLTPPKVYTNERFGFAVAINAKGNTLAVTAPAHPKLKKVGISNKKVSDDATGAVYRFNYEDSTWQVPSLIEAPNAGENDQFGISVTMSANGQTLLVGANGESSQSKGINSKQNNYATNTGAAYVY
jgi:hypothetical protein